MQQNLKWAMLTLAFSTLVSACKDEGGASNRPRPRNQDTDTGQTPNETASWTLLVYMLGDNNLEPFSLLDLVEMTAAGESQDVNIIVELDRVEGYADVWGDWTQTKRFRVVKDDVVELEDLGEQNLGAPAVLKDFIAWGVETFPAEHTGLILWDHGAGWIGYGEDESSKSDLMTYAELQEALDSGLKASGLAKFDLVGFDACLMANWETATHIRPFADYFLASEQLAPGHGWDYAVLRSLVQEPSMTVVELGERIMSGFKSQAESEGTARDITLSLTDLSKLNKVSEALGDLSSMLVANMSQDAAALAKSLSATMEFGANENPDAAMNLFDLGLLAENLATVEPKYTDAAGALNDALDEAVVSLVAGDVTMDATGLSVYFPLNPAYYWSAYDDAASDLAWYDVIRAFYQTAAGVSPDSGPVFVNPDKIADSAWDDATSSLLLGGQLETGTYDAVTQTSIAFGVSGTDEELIYLGELPAAMDASGYVAGAWSTEVFVIGQETTDSTHYEFCYVAWTAEGDYFQANVPLRYVTSSNSAGTDVNWLVVFDGNSGAVIESGLYMASVTGAVGELTPEPGSLLFPLGLYSADGGGTFTWENVATEGLVADEPFELFSILLPADTAVTAAVIAADFAGNADAVFFSGVL